MESDDFHRRLEPDVIITHGDRPTTNEDLEDEEDEIEDSDEEGEDDDDQDDEQTIIFNHRDKQKIKSMGPDISIIPISSAQTTHNNGGGIKIRFRRDYSQMHHDNYRSHRRRKRNGNHNNGNMADSTSSPPESKQKRAPRAAVRLVSKDEAEKAGETYARRKSLPLTKCPICKKFFRRMQTHLLKHQQAERAPEDPLTCNFCMKGFNTQSNLLIHMRTHTGDKPYICDVCHKGFAQSCNLVNHMRIHTGERPFKCPHCERAFTQSGNLNNHIRLHTDEKPFKCHFCDKAFVQSGNLNSHIRNNHKFAVGGEGAQETADQQLC